MTMCRVGNTLCLTVSSRLVDYNHESGDIDQINLDIFLFLKGTVVWSDSVVN